jgi:hypothetical protein
MLALYAAPIAMDDNYAPSRKMFRYVVAKGFIILANAMDLVTNDAPRFVVDFLIIGLAIHAWSRPNVVTRSASPRAPLSFGTHIFL